MLNSNIENQTLKNVTLSDALERFPSLVYLPQTRQLVIASWVKETTLDDDGCTPPAPTPKYQASVPISNTVSTISKVSNNSRSYFKDKEEEVFEASILLKDEKCNSSTTGGATEEQFDLKEEEKEEDVTPGTEMTTTLTADHCHCATDDLLCSSPSSLVSATDDVELTQSNRCSISSEDFIITKDLEEMSICSDPIVANSISPSSSSVSSFISSSIVKDDVCGCPSPLRPPPPQVQVEKTKKTSLTSFFTSALFGGRGANVSQSQRKAQPQKTISYAMKQAEKVKSEEKKGTSLTIKKSDLKKSTTALILQPRPQGLPVKTREEEAKHLQLYQAMVEEAKNKERKDVKQLQQKMKQQLKQEKMTVNALKMWNNEILSNWETLKNSRRVRDLCWTGIPPSVRGRVWKLAIANELNITSELYEICLSRAKDRFRFLKDNGSDSDSISSFTEFTAISRESSVDLIRLDVSRTFPNLCIFQKGGPYYELLEGLLGAYACYRPDVGYVQGMSYIAAMLLLNMDVSDAFICFANLLNKPCLLAFFRLDQQLMKSYFGTFDDFFQENLSQLNKHFKQQNLTPDLYLLDWLFTLYAKSFCLDVVSRMWDVYFHEGEEFLFRAALGILRLYEDVLINFDFIHLAQFLTRLPSDIACDDLFHCLATVSMEIDKKQFAQVLSKRRNVREI